MFSIQEIKLSASRCNAVGAALVWVGALIVWALTPIILFSVVVSGLMEWSFNRWCLKK